MPPELTLSSSNFPPTKPEFVEGTCRRGVRTAQRWHLELQLPVQRVKASSRSPVFAFKLELDYWTRQKAGRDGRAADSGQDRTPVYSAVERQ
jgi:hypothetical protein